MVDLILFQQRGKSYTKGMKGISRSRALELLQKHKAACWHDSNPPEEGSYLEIIFKNPSDIPSELAKEFANRKCLLIFDQPDTATKIFKDS